MKLPDVDSFIAQGQELGYTNSALEQYVEQCLERFDEEQEREWAAREAEWLAKEKEREREFELERLRLQAERLSRVRTADRLEREAEAERAANEREAEAEQDDGQEFTAVSQGAGEGPRSPRKNGPRDDSTRCHDYFPRARYTPENRSPNFSRKIKCYACKGFGHIARVCANTLGTSRRQCYNCGRYGHIARNCLYQRAQYLGPNKFILRRKNQSMSQREMQVAQKETTSSGNRHRWTSSRQCYTCEEFGHIAKECPNHKHKDSTSGNEKRDSKDLENIITRVKSLEEKFEAERAAHLEIKCTLENVQVRLRNLEKTLEAEKAANKYDGAEKDLIKQVRELEQTYDEGKARKVYLRSQLGKRKEEKTDISITRIPVFCRNYQRNSLLNHKRLISMDASSSRVSVFS
ncbi:uncharacterized protein LOC112559796 isoform X2 [Pomacea canaliculata]|uniref:uncharacterized protein LOC112559796 isoform X2 n=1 Tax=Pomacea canaliculata TaxID=400727 RepID=UPI000D739B45|nr:uncharacterized protein LOC112559796 isoform X2 [Pomacea canaliculata]